MNELNANSSPVVCAFPGTGKTYMYELYKERACIFDSDSSKFSWLEPGVRNPEFPNNYIEHIKEEIKNGAQIILVSTHSVVRKALLENDIPFTIVYPHIEDKEVYLRRYRTRGSSDDFIKMMDENYEKFITEIMDEVSQNPNMIDPIVLESHQYITDRIAYVDYNEDNTDIANFYSIDMCVKGLRGVSDYIDLMGYPETAERIDLICDKIEEIADSLSANLNLMQDKLSKLNENLNKIESIQSAIGELSEDTEENMVNISKICTNE